MAILSYNIIIANGVVVKILNQLKKVNIQVFFIHNAINSYFLLKIKLIEIKILCLMKAYFLLIKI